MIYMMDKFKRLDEVLTPQSDESTPKLDELVVAMEKSVENRRMSEEEENNKVSMDVESRFEVEEEMRRNEIINGDYFSHESFNRVENGSALVKYINKTRKFFKRAELVCNQFIGLIRQDSFKFLRLSLSLAILALSLLFFCLTFFQDEDFYENLFHVVKNYVFVNNPTNNLRAN